jgi:hypothetical protein
MLKILFKYLTLMVLLLVSNLTYGTAEKFRAMWREDPATTMVIGWNQLSGQHPVMLIDVIDHGEDASAYAQIVEPSYTNSGKDMNNHFIRLRNLHPNTVYYFLIRDSEGTSRRYSFKTLPDNPNERLSIIAGGDSRNNVEARREANFLVSKLRPHCIMFGGDMTGGDSALEWQKWLEDWQLTIARDGRIIPIIVTRGNHESSNQSLIDMFDVKARDLYYALTLGGNLVRIYTLNSMIPSGGSQKAWLERDLKANPNTIWKFAQYHKTIRPHTSKKRNHNEQYSDWAGTFYQHRINLVVESDAHVVKSTWPIRPSRNGDAGFERDDVTGTVYVGEGCWGAPLRPSDSDKSWTRNSGSFNQFKWIFIDKNKIEVRTVKTDGARTVGNVSPQNVFQEPSNLKLWNPSNGSVITILNRGQTPTKPERFPPVAGHQEPVLNPTTPPRTRPSMEIIDFQVNLDGKDIEIAWQTQYETPGTDFEVERSTDGQNYESIVILEGKGGEVADYTYMDWDIGKKKPGTYINYRIKVILPNGKSHRDIPKGKKRKTPDAPKPTVAAEVTKLVPEPGGDLNVSYTLSHTADVTMILLNPKMELVKRKIFSGQPSGNHTQRMELNGVKPGRYQLIVKAGKDVVKRYRVSF